jgi:outer membrane biosynthesis protein TonB
VKTPPPKGKSIVEPKDSGKIEKPKPSPDASLTKKPAKSPEGGEPSLDDLLKEAGGESKKEPAKPKLDKKSLSGDDMKKGMSGVSAKAQACYAGTQGTANVKLTVAPSGHVQKVTVTGAFAGTAVGNCVETAVKGATFPPWDGPPQSFGFSYLLSE